MGYAWMHRNWSDLDFFVKPTGLPVSFTGWRVRLLKVWADMTQEVLGVLSPVKLTKKPVTLAVEDAGLISVITPQPIERMQERAALMPLVWTLPN